MLDQLQERFEFLSHTANTPARFVDGAVRPDGDIKRMMLDRANYYATTGGHGACRGCGEVTAIRLVMSANHAIQGKRRKEHIVDLERLIETARRPSVRPVQDDAARRDRIDADAGDAREAAVPARERPDRQRPGLGRDRERDRLQQRLCVDVPVQSVPGPVGEQPVPGHAGGRQGPVRRPDGERHRRHQGVAHRAPGTRGRLPAGGPRPLLPDVRLGPVHAAGTRAAADRVQRRRRRGDLRHRLRRAVAAAHDQHADQGDGAQHGRVLEHGRPGLDGEPHRAGLRPDALRRRPCRQAGRPQGTRPDRRVPPERVRGADLDGAAGALPRQRHGVPQLHGVARRCSTCTRRARRSTASPMRRPADARAWRSKAA